MWDTVACS